MPATAFPSRVTTLRVVTRLRTLRVLFGIAGGSGPRSGRGA
jgi:hypothetical protein